MVANPRTPPRIADPGAGCHRTTHRRVSSAVVDLQVDRRRPCGGGSDREPRRVASVLTGFLRELHSIDAGGGPPPGAHNFFRGGALDIYDAQTRQSIQLLDDEIDTAAATEVWGVALTSAWDRPPVWVHGDVAPSNLLVEDGKLRAIIDFGCAAVGDPACDLVMAWTFFTDESREVFRLGLHLDDNTWERGRGWALWKALITLADDKRGGPDSDAAARSVGWRINAREVIDLVLSDHARPT